MTSAPHREIRVRAQGRVVIPATLRQAIQLQEDASPVDELLAERRAEAGRAIAWTGKQA